MAVALNEDPLRCFLEVAAAAIDGLDRIGTRDRASEVNDWEPEDRRRPISPQFLVNLLQALRRFKKATLCDAAAEKIAARPELFKPVTLVVPDARTDLCDMGNQSRRADSSIVHLWTNSTRFLLQRSEFPPEPPADWRLDVKLSCSCPDCRELQAFSLDPLERIHRFRVKKERRQHPHMIDRHRLDMAHITERVGSPQTLVCTKDRRTFDLRMKEYKNEIGAMRSPFEWRQRLTAPSLCAGE